METIFFHSNNLDQAAELIKKGELVAFPTETVYGLGADATRDLAVKKVYEAKGRPSDNPVIVHLAKKEDIYQYVDNLPQNAEKLMEIFWPGPLTLIVNVKKGVFPASVSGGLSTVSFRMPNNKKTLELIEKSGVPIVGPSANTSGKPSPTTAQHVYHDLHGKIAGIVDDGKTEVGLESTVLDVSVEGTPIILRPGGITKGQLEAVIGPVIYDQHLLNASEKPKAPGMKYKHYSPNTNVVMIDYEKQDWQEAIKESTLKNQKIGLLASREVIEEFSKKAHATFVLTEKNRVEEAMQNLFEGLRALDEVEPSLDVMFVETFVEDGLGIAYMNRLKKAANQEYFEI